MKFEKEKAEEAITGFVLHVSQKSFHGYHACSYCEIMIQIFS